MIPAIPRLTCAGLLSLLFAAAAVAAVAAASTPPPAAADAREPSPFRDPVDGKFDVSQFVDKAYGFVPLVIPITEPAVGYGAAAGLVFIDRPKNPAPGSFARPSIWAVGGMVTENGTTGVFGGDSRYWLNGRLHTLVGAVKASVNLDYYGSGENTALSEHPLRYNLAPVGGLVDAKYRLGDSHWWGGLRYLLASTDVSFNAPSGTPGLPSFQANSKIGGLTPTLSYDTRDNIFTPTKGFYAEAGVDLFSETVGSDYNFQKVNGVAMYYAPLAEKLTLGLRGDVKLSYGDVPFYLKPFVMMRGVAAMRYMGDDVAQLEGELRWQCWGRYSLVGFGGVGMTRKNTGLVQNEHTVTAYGAGIRYEIARKYGLHMGLDVAFGPDDPIIYIQFGSAWMRP